MRSAPIPERDENLLTLGVGYYAETEKNLPILRELHLDKGFVRSENQYGTDVYIIGFNNFKGWQYDIIAKVLESFMVAVMCGGLEVIVDGIVVNQNTVSSIIYDEVFQGGRGKIEYREIRAQYELLQNDESVIVKEIPIDENNTVTVYLKQYGQQDESNATKHCVMVVKPQTPKTAKAGEAGETYEFGEGELVENGESGKKPRKKPKPKPQPNPNPKSEPKDQTEVGPGKSPVLKKVPLSGMRYRTVVTNKVTGKYDCIFTSQYDENDCEFAIRLCGEAADKYPVDILSASIDGVECTVQDGKIVGMKIEKGKTYKISYSVNSTEMFASEVILSAYR